MSCFWFWHLLAAKIKYDEYVRRIRIEFKPCCRGALSQLFDRYQFHPFFHFKYIHFAWVKYLGSQMEDDGSGNYSNYNVIFLSITYNIL